MEAIDPKNNTKPYQECVSCWGKWHTYLACDKVDFFWSILNDMYRKN